LFQGRFKAVIVDPEFLMNFKPEARDVTRDGPYLDTLAGGNLAGCVELPP
jgi:hypothetical protein